MAGAGRLLLGTVARRASVGLAGGAGVFAADDVVRNRGDRLSGLTRFSRSVLVASEVASDYKFFHRWRTPRKDVAQEGDKNEEWRRCHKRNAMRIRRLCERNGGLYIKFGQHLAQLEHLLPWEYCETLSSLLATCPPRSFDSVQRTLKNELQVESIEDVFESFDPTPIATASLAQVHVGVLKESGRKVAVKVQHEGLREASRGDILTVKMLFHAATALFPEFDYRWIAEETAENLPQELDFSREGRNAERCRLNLGPQDDATTPEVLWKLSTPRVLTMSFEEGCHVMEADKIREMGLDPTDVSRILAQTFTDQIFVHGFLHCDPHGANILVRPHPRRRGRPQLVLLDHGLYRDLSPDFRLDYAHLWHGLVVGDVDEIRTSAIAMGAGEDTYPLFAAMLTLRTWDTILGEGDAAAAQKASSSFDRIGREQIESGQEQQRQEEMRGYAEQYFKEISDLLRKMPRQLLLVLKTGDNLRCVDRALGATVNTLTITAETVARVIEDQEVSQNPADWSVALHARIRTYGMLLRVFLYRIMVSCSELRARIQQCLQ